MLHIKLHHHFDISIKQYNNLIHNVKGWNNFYKLFSYNELFITLQINNYILGKKLDCQFPD